MAALSCEICGGKLMAKAGGIFECDSCGMLYDKSRIQEMVQEIKGTVKVEGTVQVEGTVKVEGGVNIDSLLKRGQLALEDQQWEKATQYFDDALNLDAECAEAYLGKFFARNKVSDLEKLFEKANNPCNTEKMVGELKSDSDLQKARRFSSTQETAQLLNRIEELQNLAQTQKENRDEVRIAASKRIAPVQAMICVGSDHTVGLKADGTVVAAGWNHKGQCNVSDWRDVVAISAGPTHTVGLRSDGTVVAVGQNDEGQCDVSDWRDVVAISAGSSHTVGLRSDGTVVAAGRGHEGQCNVSYWRDVVAICAGTCYTVGLRSDGTVVAVGSNYDGQCNVSDWRDVVAICVGAGRTVDLRSNGTVVSTDSREQVSYWRNVVAICAGILYTVGLRSDGTVVKVGDGSGNLMMSWKLFNALETIEQERKEAAERRAEEARLEAERKAKCTAELNAEKTALMTEYSQLKGLFCGKRRKEIDARVAEINRKLESLS